MEVVFFQFQFQVGDVERFIFGGTVNCNVLLGES